MKPVCTSVFDATLERFAQEASSGCGLSDTLFTERFSAKVTAFANTLPAHQQAELFAQARSYGYLTPSEVSKQQDELRDQGYCRCGLDYMTCPSGCFEGGYGYED